jgi:hypothetical protein
MGQFSLFDRYSFGLSSIKTQSQRFIAQHLAGPQGPRFDLANIDHSPAVSSQVSLSKDGLKQC